MTHKVLVIDDQEATRYLFQKYLGRGGFQVDEAHSIAAARMAVAKSRYDAVILDLVLPDGNGLDWLPELVESSPNTTIVIITGAGDVPLAVEAMRRGADNFLLKPVDMRGIEDFLRKSLVMGQLTRKDRIEKRLHTKREPFYGKNPKMQEVHELCELAGKSEVPVLLQGETGTGKGVFAKWIHENSARADLPFIEVNCSVLRGDLLASELFGHARGAFTSAVEHKQGLLDVADGGTLFLDEISDMDPNVQAQFLKAVEEKKYRRLGEVTERRSDFRLISATNSSLLELIEQGKFRRDLYYRVSVHPIHLPGLAERISDLSQIIDYLLSSYSPKPSISREAMDLLKAYPWPGNIRELKNVLERAVLLSQNKLLEAKHFGGIQQNTAPKMIRKSKEDLLKVLERFEGDKNRAAAYLGMSRATFYRKLRKLAG